MPDYELSYPYQLGSDPPMVGLAQEVLRGRKVEQAQELELAKGAVTSLINTYHDAKSGAMREHVVETLRSYHSSLPQGLRMQIEPYIAHSPISPMEEKRREFTKYNPPPQEPMVREGEENSPFMEQRRAQFEFQRSDYDRQLKSFLFGSDAAGEKLNFIPFGEGKAAIRGSDGRVTIMTKEDMMLKEVSEKTGVSVKDIFLNQGVVPTGRKGFVVVNGRKITTEERMNIFATKEEEKYFQKQVNVETMPESNQQIKHPSGLTALLLDWKAATPKDRGLRAMKELARDNPQRAASELQTMYPEYTFRVFQTKEPSFLGKWNPFMSWDGEFAIVPIPGSKTIALQDSKGQRGKFYYNPNTDLVFNQDGRALGTLAQAQLLVANSILGGKK